MTETFFCDRHSSHYYNPPGCLRCIEEPLDATPVAKRWDDRWTSCKHESFSAAPERDGGESHVSDLRCDGCGMLKLQVEANRTAAALACAEGDLGQKQWELDECVRKANESNRLIGERCNTLQDLLGELFQWCENNVPYFGEAAKGSYDEAVYRRVAKALGNEYTGSHPEPARE